MYRGRQPRVLACNVGLLSRKRDGQVSGRGCLKSHCCKKTTRELLAKICILDEFYFCQNQPLIGNSLGKTWPTWSKRAAIDSITGGGFCYNNQGGRQKRQKDMKVQGSIWAKLKYGVQDTAKWWMIWGKVTKGGKGITFLKADFALSPVGHEPPEDATWTLCGFRQRHNWLWWQKWDRTIEGKHMR